jgi:uncharacterized protein YdbL (DUF1318 family)
MKLIASLAATAAVGIVLMTGTAAPARAATCYYKAVKLDGRVIEDLRGMATAIKNSTACDRARRECNRRLDRAYRKGEMPRGVVCKKSG